MSGPDEGPTTARTVAAEREEPFVVFHIGMRINRLWRVHRWLPVVLVAPRMVRELAADPDSGLLGSRTVLGPGPRNLGFVQYWDSFAALRRYAHDPEGRHLPAWQRYDGDGARGDDAVGIWHETYLVEPDAYETVYDSMPPHGLGAADGTTLVPATGERGSATRRLGRADGGRDRDGTGPE